MASIVKVPTDTNVDYSYIAFSFNGLHSYEDFGIYRTSDGSTGYNENLLAQREEKIIEVPGMDGELYFGFEYRARTFQINFAFDKLTETNYEKMRKWLSAKGIYDLWFAEAPHKVYSAKVTGLSTAKTIAFSDGSGERIYKGTGSVQFTCHFPFARTPKFIQSGTTLSSGRNVDSYEDFGGEIQNIVAADFTRKGDLPYYFVAKGESPSKEEGGGEMVSKTYTVSQTIEDIKIDHSITLTISEGDILKYEDYQWDSRTGLVTAKLKGETKRVVLPYSGNGIVALQPGIEPEKSNTISSLDYDYLYL